MRALFVILVLANAGFAAWALLVDRSGEPAVARDISKLKPLVLLAEVSAGKTGTPSSAGAPVMGSAPGASSAPVAAEPPRCVTVGPFEELQRAAAAAALLKSRGFAPRQRAEGGDDLVEYWVYLGGFASDAAEARVLKQLRSKGLSDAAAMPATDHGRRLSLGLFTDQARAEHRARDARALGVTPQIEEQRHAEATYWVDVALVSLDQTVSLDGLLPAGSQDAHLTLRSCPSSLEAAASSAPSSAPASAPVPGAAPVPGSASAPAHKPL